MFIETRDGVIDICFIKFCAQIKMQYSFNFFRLSKSPENISLCFGDAKIWSMPPYQGEGSICDLFPKQ